MISPRIPIFQAPTASIAGPELAAAVTLAGGVGAMGLTWTQPRSAVAKVESVRSQTDGPFQVNFALAFPPAALEAVLAAGVPIVTFSWGDATPYVDQVHRAGALVGVQVTNPQGAKKARLAGADFLICQGLEAGGHVQSTTALDDLLPRVIEAAAGIPVLAAGGLGNGRDIRRVLNLGAFGAVLGTRFVATRESLAHPLYKQLLVEQKETALTVCFDGGWPYAPHRVLRNSTFEAWEAAGSPPSPLRPGEGDVLGPDIVRYEDAAPQSHTTGDIEAMCLYAGTSCALIDDIPAAGDLVRRLWAEAIAAGQ